MSGHLDGPPPGPPDPPYIPGDLGAPSAKEFARRRAGDVASENAARSAAAVHDAFAAGRAAATPDPPDEDAVTAVVRVLNRTMDLTARERAVAVLAAVPASPDPLSREAIEALPRWIAVEQAGGHHPNVNGPGPVMHAAVLLDDLLDLLAAPSHRGDEAAGTPAAVLNTEPSSGAASPDERLREAGDRLAQAVARVCGEGHPALGMWRVALGTDARGKPDGASVPDQTRRIVVYDARCGRGGLDVPVGCTVGEAALLAAEMFGVRVGPNDRPSFGLRGTGLHASDPLPDDEDYELFVIGGTV